jgi:uncharacterized protein YndB with AHSA1/START domain
MQDVIRREITIHAPQAKVYSAITDPAQIVKWFPDTIDGSLAEGEQPIFGFGEHGKTQVFIVSATPHDYFAFRWVPGGNHTLGDVRDIPTTLVEFRIAEVDGVSSVTLTESGFASIAPEIAEQSFRDNSGGWDFMMDRLGKLFLEK